MLLRAVFYMEFRLLRCKHNSFQILFCQPFHFILHLLNDFIRTCDFYSGAKRHDPAQKLAAGDHIHMHTEGIFIDGNQGNILAEAVNDDSGLVVAAFQRHAGFLPSEHAEDGLGVLCHIKAFEGFLSLAPCLDNTQILHLIHTIMLDFVRSCVITNEVVVFVVPHQAPGADLIQRAIMPQNRIALEIPLEIVEGDLFAVRDGRVDGIHVVVDQLVRSLDSSGYNDLPLQLPCLIYADEVFQLFDQRLRFLIRDEFGGLYRVYQEL